MGEDIPDGAPGSLAGYRDIAGAAPVPQERFAKYELRPSDRTDWYAQHDSALQQLTRRSIGSGNHGIVCSVSNPKATGTGKQCAKFIWSPATTVAGIMKDPTAKKRHLLPPRGQSLLKISGYYQFVESEIRRRMADTNGVFAPKNTVLQEAERQNFARAVLAARGMGRVPEIFQVVKFDLEEEGDAGAEERYFIEEHGHSMLMEQVDGLSLSDLRRGGWRNRRDILENLDPETFSVELLAMVQALHEAGLVHQDTTARNIMVDAAGKPWIIDFGKTALVGSSQAVIPLKEELDHAQTCANLVRRIKADPKAEEETAARDDEGILTFR